MLEDITERKQDREALHESEVRFRALYEGAGTGIFVTNKEYQILDSNPAFEQLMGYSKEESLNMKLKDFSHSDDIALDELLGEAFESGTDTFSLVKRYIRKDGRVIWGKLSASLVRDEANEFHLMFGMVEDITEQAKAAEALSKSEEKFRSIFEESAIANNLYDSDGILIDVNKAGLELAGVSSVVDILGFKLFEDPNLPEDVKARVLQSETVRFLSTFDFEKVKELSLFETSKSGIAYIDTVVAPFGLKDDGSPQGYFVQMQDVTEHTVAIEALRNSETRFRTMFERAGIGMTIVSPDDELLETNPAMLKMLGYSAEEMVELIVSDFSHPEDMEEDSRLAKEATESGTDAYQIEKRYFRKDGNMVWGKLTWTLVRATDGTPSFALGMVEDITEQKQAEESLQKSEKRFRSVYENAAVAMAIVDMQGKIEEINPAGLKLFGYEEDELIQRRVADITHPEDMELELELNNEMFEGKRDHYTLEKRFFRKDGAVVWGNLTVSVSRDESGEILFVIGMVEDITERKKAEDELRKNQDLFRSTIESTGHGLLVTSSTEEVLHWNSRFGEMWGIPESQIESIIDDRQLMGYVLDTLEDPISFTSRVTELYLSDEQVLDLIRLKDSRIFERLSSPLIQDGKNVGRVWTFKDITALNVAQEALKKSEEEFRRIFEDSPVAIDVFDSNGDILDVNKASLEMFGISSIDALKGFNLFDDSNITPEMGNRLKNGEIVSFETVFDFDQMNQQGLYKTSRSGYRYHHVTLGSLRSEMIDSVRGYIVQTQDITEKKKAELAIKASEARFRTIFENAAIGMTIVDNEDRIIEANDAFLKIIGYDLDELKEMKIADFTYPEDAEEDARLFSEIIQLKRKSYRMEKRYINKDGETIWADLTVTCTRNESGEIEFIVGMTQDITERKIAEDALMTTQENLQAIVDNSPDNIMLLDSKSNVVFINRTVPGLDKESMIGVPVYEVRNPEEADTLRSKLELIMETKESIEYQVEYDDNIAGKIIFNVRIKPVLKNKEIVGFTVNSQDVTAYNLATQRIREERDRAEKYLDIVGSMVVSLDTNGIVTLINRKGCEILGLDAEDIIGKNWVEHFIPSRIKEQIQQVHSKISSGNVSEVEEFENPVISEDGQEKMLLWRNVVLRDSNGTAIGSLSSGVDITDRKIAEDTLRHSEEKFRAIFEKAGVGIMFLNTKQNVLDANEAAQTLLGYSHDELTQMHLKNISHPDDVDLDSASIQGLLQGDYDHFHKEKRYLRRDGSFFWARTTGSVVRNAEGMAEYTVGIIEDISQRKTAEQSLKDTTRLLEKILDTTNLEMAFLDPQFNYVRVNRAYAHAVEREPSYFPEKNIFELHPNAEIEEHFHVTMSTGEPIYSISSSFVYPDHPEFGVRYKDWSLIPIVDSEKQVTGLVLSMVDNTDSKLADQALRDSEEKYRSLVSNLVSVVVELNQDWDYSYVSPQIRTVLGYEPDELLGHSALDFVHPEDRGNVEKRLSRNYDGSNLQGFEYRLLHKAGHYVTVSGSGRIVVEDNSVRYIGVMEDITESKKTQEALRNSEAKLAFAFSNSPVYMTITNWETGKIIDTNEAFSLATGYTQEELKGGSREDLNLWANPNQLETILKELNEQTTPQSYEIDVRKKSGDTFTVLYSAQLVEIGGEKHVISSGTDISKRIEIQEALAQSEAKYRQLVDDSMQGFAILQDGKYVYVNSSFAEARGYSGKELLSFSSQEVWDMIHPDDKQDLQERIALLDSEHESLPMKQFRYIQPDGSIRWVESFVKATEFENNSAIQVLEIDITERIIAEDALRYQAEILQSVSDMVFSTNAVGTILSWNKAAEDVLGWTENEAIGKHVNDLLLSDFINKSFEDMVDDIRAQDKWQGEAIISRKDGQRLHVLSSVSTLKDENGTVTGAVAVSRDITSRRQAKLALESSEVKYRALFENLPTAYAFHRIILDDEFRPIDYEFVEVNELFEEFTGLNAEEIIGRRVTEVIPGIEDDEVDWIGFYGKVVLTKEPATFEQYSAQLDRWYSIVSYSPLEGHFVCLFSDITERKKSDRALEESERRFRDVAESTSDWIWEVDANGAYTYVGSRIRDVLGYEPEEVLGRTPFDMMPPDEAAKILEIFSEISKGKKRIQDLENWNTHKDGHMVCLLTNGVPILDEAGTLLGYRGVDKDITAKKQADLELRKLSHAVEQSPISIVITDTEGTIEYVNPTFTKLTGYSLEEAIGQNPRILQSDLTPRETYDELWNQITSGMNWRGSFVNKKKDGELYWEDARISPIKDSEGVITHFVAAKEDISDRKRSEDNLRESEERYRTVVKSMEELVFVYDSEDRITQFHASNDSLLLLPPQDFIGKPATEVLPAHVAKPLTELLRVVRTTKESQTFDYTLTINEKEIMFSASLSPHEDGISVVSVVRNVTDYTDAYEHLRIQKEELSEFAHSMNHDLNNYFLKIRVISKLLESEPNPDHTKKINDLLVEMSDLLKHSVTLADAGLAVEKEEVVSLGKLITTLAKQHIPDEVAFSLDIKTGDAFSYVLDFNSVEPEVWADETKVRQILVNILKNAVLHGKPQKIKVRLERTEEGLSLQIINDGDPITPETRTKIFERGFSTKEGRIGFGLSIVKKLIEAHGWTINLLETEDTTFEIKIPRDDLKIS
ncbi:MAG: PAS domain S-box protein, partial [Candidatus Thorarchaeota archaeon]|nr:PAS domain S-box protein [Candidatus Thorarchaeota archaeon]